MLKKIKSPLLRYGLLAIISCFLVGLGFFLSVYFGAWGKLPSKETLSNLQYQRASEVYSSDSVLIGKYYLFDRQPIDYKEFPEHLIDALVAIEDERFYEHKGVDYRSLFRVAFKTILMQDKSSGGGSTITQQLAKNIHPRIQSGTIGLAADKVKEMIIASRLEGIYTKEEVLTHYLNTVSFGDNTFGIESASLRFFNKKTRALNIEEAAVLVGMLKATYGYNPRIFPETSRKRRNLVFGALFLNDYITETEKDSLIELPLTIHYKKYDHNEGIAAYFREQVRKQMLRWCEEKNEEGASYNLYTSGLKIYTTLDYKMQQSAEKAMVQHMKSLQNQFEKGYGKSAPWLRDKKLIKKTVQKTTVYQKLISGGLTKQEAWDSLAYKKPLLLSNWNGEKEVQASTIDSIQHYMKFLNTGSLSLDPVTGAVKTWIGGIQYRHFKFDHIAQSKRQVGSTFKPIVYTAALEKGIEPCTYFSAQEVSYKNLEGWSPGNSEKKDEIFLNYSMKEALSKSVNTVSVKVLEKTGIPTVIEQAKKMGIRSKLPELPSLALGTGELSILELAAAYTTYVNNASVASPYLIQSIASSENVVLQTFQPKISKEPAFSEETRQTMIQLMKATVDHGTASRIRTTYGLKNDIAGKTGTTQNNKDAWFVAVMPRLVSVTWVGLEHHEIGFSSTRIGQGANAALPIFALWLKELNKDASFQEITGARFKTPDPVILAALDCEPIKRDGFFKRLFKNKKKKKRKKFKTKA